MLIENNNKYEINMKKNKYEKNKYEKKNRIKIKMAHLKSKLRKN